jgi:hypothetical protein
MATPFLLIFFGLIYSKDRLNRGSIKFSADPHKTQPEKEVPLIRGI